METPQALSIESFSYSWLTNRNFSFDCPSEPLRPSLDFSYEATSEETKYRRVGSKRTEDFNFDVPISKSPSALVHADEIFSSGHILPRYGDPSNMEAFNTFNASNSVLSLPMSSISLRTVCLGDRIHFNFLKRWGKSSKRILQKYLGFFRPLCRKVGCSRRSVIVDDIDRKVWMVREVKSWNCSPQASPPRGMANSVGNWREMKRKGTKTAETIRKVKSWNNSPQASPGRSPSYFSDDWSIDSSIHEAILHCKRSFEK